MRKLLLSCFLFLGLLLPLPAQQTDAEALFAKFKTASRFDFTYPREKVYLHLDNSAYLENDTIWYKAYVVRASKLRPTTLSRVLYVELLNADGQLMEKQILKVDRHGQADGCFKLKLPIRAGFYEVRAYTRAMTNWDEPALFSRIVPVYTSSNPQKKEAYTASTTLTDLSIPEPTANKLVTIGSPRPYQLKEVKDRLLSFYPEGGQRVGGIRQQIAFKLTDGRGRATDDTLRIYRSDGSLLCEVQMEHEGMGSFILPADFTDGYARISGEALHRRLKEEPHPLPEARGRYGLHAEVDTGGIAVTVVGGEAARGSRLTLGLSVVNRELACYFDTITPSMEPQEIYIPKSSLRSGVNHLTLHDREGRTLASRLVWTQLDDLKERRARVVVRQNEAIYEPFSPAALELEVHDSEGRPLRTTLSVAVRDRSGNITSTRDGGILADLLLASELRGYIHRPDLYFARYDAAHRRMLDLLMMVQGWTANRFELMAGADTFKVSQPIEDRLILRGMVAEDSKKRRPLEGYKIKFQAYSRSGSSIDGEAVTKKDGTFAFGSKVNFSGDFIAQFTIRNKLGRKKWVRLMLDRWFAPEPRPFSGAELEMNLPTPLEDLVAESAAEKPVVFEWKDTIPRMIPTALGEAKVVAKGKYRGFTGNRYTWGGGERTGMGRATKYFNVQQEVERMKDMGLEPMDVFTLMGRMSTMEMRFFRNVGWDFLDRNVENSSRLNLERVGGGSLDSPGLNDPDGEWADAPALRSHLPVWQRITGGTLTDYDLVYQGREWKVYFDNEPYTKMAGLYPELMSELYSEEIKSVCLVADSYATDAVSGRKKSSRRYSMYIYSLPDYYRFRDSRGVDRRRVQGFTQPTVFYAPNYRSFDLPAEGDLRRTLHWNPSVRTDKDGRASVVFFTNARESQYLDISVRGLTENGVFIEFDR